MVAVEKANLTWKVHSAKYSMISKVLKKASPQISLSLPQTPATPSGGDNTSVALKCKRLIQKVG